MTLALPDHVLVEALTALVMPTVSNSRELAMLIDIAAGVVDAVNRDIDPLCKVVRAFVVWQAARRQRSRPYSETLGLNAALTDFHRWRLGQAQAAMKAKAA